MRDDVASRAGNSERIGNREVEYYLAHLQDHPVRF
jgi:hypothetical protein